MAAAGPTRLTTVDGLVIKGKIADGGLSEVFLAYEGKTPIALKMLAPRLLQDRSARRKMAHEGRMGLQLEKHPNVIESLRIGSTGGRPYLVLEYFRSQSLRMLLQKHKKFRAHEAVPIAEQVAAGMGHIHAARIIHRDIKPENILVNEQGKVKIIDLGIAATRLANWLPWMRTASGSLSYMSPEQIRRRRVDERSDIYSFGCMLYELLVGKPPFTSNNPQSLIRLHLDPNAAPKPASQNGADIPHELDKLIGVCLQKDPALRPPSTLSLFNKLHKIAQAVARQER